MSSHRYKGYISKILIIFLSLILGIASSYAWFFGYIEFVREMVPYACAFAIFILITTSIFKAKCGSTEYYSESDGHQVNSTYSSVCKYSTFITIASSLFVAFSITMLATHLSVITRFVLSLIGSISFWTMFFSFVSMICCIHLKRKQ